MPEQLRPTAAEYRNEPVQYSALKIVDLNSEASTIGQPYRNIVLNQINNSCLHEHSTFRLGFVADLGWAR
jgi:hypothetical protein